MANRTATLYIRITTSDGRKSYCTPVYQSKGRLKPQHAMVKGQPRPQVREILIRKKMKHWWLLSQCRLIDPTCPTWRARKNYSRLCAKYPHIMTKLGLTEFSAY